MRTRRKPWTNNELLTNKYLVEYPDENIGHWAEVFGNDRPLYIEIGCGKGKFIIENARRYPDINFVGIEKEAAVIASAIRLARESGEYNNLMFLVRNAQDLGYVFAKGEVKRIYLNFSDPWANRKKWAKRRLTHRLFLEIYEGLCESCEIFFKTDDLPLFEFSLEEFTACGFELSEITRDLHAECSDSNIMTEYEEYFREQGKPVCRVVARKS